MNLPNNLPAPRAAFLPCQAWRALLAGIGAGLCLAGAAVAQPATATPPAVSRSAVPAPAPYTEVQRLLQAGQYPEALAMAEGWLAGQAADPQMRFLLGVIQSRMGNAALAGDTFTRLTQDYPELPEPYNNLAVLHAQQDRLDEARAALEMAIRLNPGYAVAHQNLGDVYARMAAQAYAQALQLSPDNAALPPRIQALRSALGDRVGSASGNASGNAPITPPAAVR